MRELKGTWCDLFNGFKIALHLSKMFLGFIGLVLTVLLVYGSVTVANIVAAEKIASPDAMWPHLFAAAQLASWHAIFEEGPWYVALVYGIVYAVLFASIWSWIGGAISRIAAYEIAKDGERIEMSKAMRFAKGKIGAFFGSFVLCVAGFLFFAFCNAAGGLVGKALSVVYVGGPLVALLLPLAILSGFIMTLILIASVVGWPLFMPAVGAEGTDSFDAVSRGFSYVYSSPWQYAGYQIVAAVYGWFCVAFVFLFTVGMCYVGLKAGGYGWHALGQVHTLPSHDAPTTEEEHRGDPRFLEVAEKAMSNFLSMESYHRGAGPNRVYRYRPEHILRHPHPYGRIMNLANYVVGCGVHGPAREVGLDPFFAHTPASEIPRWKWPFQVSYYVVTAWLFVVFGMAWGYAVSYFFSQQTMIYFLLRKKVDGIEMNEVYEEPEDEEPGPESFPPPAPAPEAKPEDKK